MALRLERASVNDAAAIAALHDAATRNLTARFGQGTWSFAVETVEGVRLELLGAKVFIAREGGAVRATLRLSEKNPWLGTTDFFTPCDRALYLTAMAVAPPWQRQGVGRACLAEVMRIASAWPVDAIRLDSYDAAAGAGNFYLRCGFQIVQQAEYHGTPLIWFERLVSRGPRELHLDRR